MTRQVYVGNLNLETTPETLREAFSTDGLSVTNVALVTSPRNGRPRGFAFVELETEEQAQQAIRALDGAEIDGRRIKVAEGKERPEIRIRSAEVVNRGGGRRRR